MKLIWFFTMWFLILHFAFAIQKRTLNLQRSSPGILDILKKPKLPGMGFQLGTHFETDSTGFTKKVVGSFGSFGFGIGMGGKLLPPMPGPNLPPKEVPEIQKDIPELPKPEITWGEKDKKGDDGLRPNWETGTEKHPKVGSFEENKDQRHQWEEERKEEPESKPHDGNKEFLPDWEDIGENKSENLMESELVADGLIQPRLNRNRNRRFIESRVYHVPLLFRSNAKPSQVKIQSNPNSLMKDDQKL